MSINVAVGLGIPFLGTALGAACVFLLQGEMNATVRKTMLGFAAGVMVAASVWSLLIPAMDLSEGMGKLAFIPAAAGFLLGILFLLVLDRVVPHLHLDSEEQEGVKSNWKKSTMLILAVTLHNIPEGASVGIVLAGAMAGGSPITMAGALALSVGIAIQNFPEGAIISLPLKEELGKGKAFLMGTMSGAVEPVAAVVTLLLAEQMTPFIPYTPCICSGSHVVCGGGRTDSGVRRRGAFQYGNAGLCGGVCHNDDSGCCTGLVLRTALRKRKTGNPDSNSLPGRILLSCRSFLISRRTKRQADGKSTAAPGGVRYANSAVQGADDFESDGQAQSEMVFFTAGLV